MPSALTQQHPPTKETNPMNTTERYIERMGEWWIHLFHEPSGSWTWQVEDRIDPDHPFISDSGSGVSTYERAFTIASTHIGHLYPEAR